MNLRLINYFYFLFSDVHWQNYSPELLDELQDELDDEHDMLQLEEELELLLLLELWLLEQLEDLLLELEQE